MGNKRFLKLSISFFLLLLIIEVAGYLTAWKDSMGQKTNPIQSKTRLIHSLKSENALFKKKIETLHPKGLYIVVDTANNLLYLNQGRNILLRAIVSCGSGAILQNPTGEKHWIFETPKGEFTIRSKFVKPTWIKPDWAFLEESKPIPTNLGERAEEGMLGDYALGFGNGYFIHGTLYTRLLGKSITHGCIRVGDQDLKTLYETVPLGTKILIF